ncbi:MAG: hypothetical protein OEM24_08925 [Paracoccaceae bacterium]|nr:hypothetical protein [Paracoccaceae bacterium]
MTNVPHLAPTSPPLCALLLCGIALVWFAAIYALAAGGAFLPAEPGPPLRFLPAVLAPPAAFLIAYRAFPGLRAWVRTLDPVLVTATQAWRVIGAAFLILWAMGDLPAVFALPAGIGDVGVGILAVSVVAQMARRADGWQRSARWLIALGLLDFVVAFGTATLAAPGMPLAPAGGPWDELMQRLPMALIPAFAVPAFIILHLIAWIRLREAAT